jgi:hypothetical protein
MDHIPIEIFTIVVQLMKLTELGIGFNQVLLNKNRISNLKLN